ncbi:hypothetical protein DFA_03762 [Cavenderia fasciculata]|uniref:Purple acid phosphatase n=1 Tax=Cavenderia fasciculata TaxID=261658 RepID=F4Q0B9_CACFS|nr:uncharacterized protein DFA_03762 [Cavenderia fasciculata]EGG18270.1 hypothetical protein DFA_03762 [Cavenderia fasciculata]|eukprot:XP_004357093.1 hypothetical protein DFA_03762 [Cavenderia fasciculata]
MAISWFTMDQGEEPTVVLSERPFEPSAGIAGLAQSSASCSSLSDEKHWHGYINTAIVKGLSSHSTYYYSCGDSKDLVWSSLYNFTTGVYPSATTTVTPFTIAAYGDMGSTGGDSVTIANLAKRTDFSFLLHVGDIAYANDSPSGNYTIWTSFLEQINQLSSTLAYQVCIGNHDTFQDEKIYQKTFIMPTEKSDETWYSFDYNGVHFVAFSTEDDYSTISKQYAWIEKELSSFRASNEFGWLIVYAHRPMYCSSSDGYCDASDKKHKDVLKYIEPLLYKYNVHLVVMGHSHSYERTLPVYENRVMGTYEQPLAPVHLVIGTAGNREGLINGWQDPAPVWSAGPRLEETGFGILSFNDSHLIYQFYLDSNDSIVDQFVLTKYSYN